VSNFDLLHPALQHHIVNSLGWRELRPFQDAVIPRLLAGDHQIVLAPTAGGKTEAADSGETFKPLSAELRQRNRDILGIRPDEFVWINLAARAGQAELGALLLRFAARKKVQPNLRLIIQAGGPITELVARYPEALGPAVLAGLMDIPFELTAEKRCAMYSMADVYVAARRDGDGPFEIEARLCELLVASSMPMMIAMGGVGN